MRGDERADIVTLLEVTR